MVAHFWFVSWSVAGPPQLAATLPHPTFHLVIGPDDAEVAGPQRATFRRELAGDGWAFGVKLRPAMWAALSARPADELADRRVALDAALGPGAAELAREVRGAPGLEVRVAAAARFLAARARRPADPWPVRLRDCVERLERDRSLARVEAVADALEVSPRQLARLFRRWVGVSPKFVLARYRVMEAAERLGTPAPAPLAALAGELGYADQAHLTREFKAQVGAAPRAYAARARVRRG